MNQNDMNTTEPAVETSDNSQAATSTVDMAREKMGEVREQAGETIANMSGQAKEKISDMTGQAKEKLVDMSGQAKEKLLEAGSQAREKLMEKGSQLAEKADQTLHQAGERMHMIAEKMREKAPVDGTLAKPLSKVADTLDTSADYLAQHGLSDIQADVTDLVRKYPVQALGAGLVLGFLLGATLSRR